MTDQKKEIEKIRAYYDDVYYAAASADGQAPGHLRRLANKIGLRPGSRVLDIACGLGEWLQVCSEHGATVCGIDLSERAIEQCRLRLPAGKFEARAAEQLPYPDATFDLVSCLGSLEHFVDPVVALREMVRVAKDDAQFLILVPNADFLTRKLRLYAGTNQTAAKEEVRTLEEWQELLLAAGLKVRRRWRDLHVLSWHWIMMNGWGAAPLRAAQALALAIWPLRWQYQVYHLCGTR